MSSFLLDAIHFNSVEKKIIGIYESKFRGFNEYCLFETMFIQDTFEDLYFVEDLTIKSDIIKSIFNNIKRLSSACITLERAEKFYTEEELENEVDQDMKWLFDNITDSKPLSDIELYKAIQCIIYQIELEHLTKYRPLYDSEFKSLKFLKDYNQSLAKFMIMKTTEYNTAKWQIQ